MHLRRSLIVLGLAVVTIPTHAHAGGAGLIIPPIEADIGITAPIGNTVTGVATDTLVGVHWASLAWFPTSIELGAGFVSSSRALLEPIGLARTSDASTTTSSTSTTSSTTPAAPQTSLDLHGGYITVGHTISDRHHIRTWVLARGELLHGELEGRAFSATGGALRLASELYVPMGGGSGGAGLIGTFAVGVYVEASHRALPDELGPDGVTTGVSLRIPFILAD